MELYQAYTSSVRLYFLSVKKEWAQGSIFLTCAKKGGNMHLYVVYEKINEKWERRNVFERFDKVIDYIHQIRAWEKRWKENGFEYAPTPGIYKVVRFTEAQTFTIED